MIIDGTDMLLGRMATFVAKKALQGEDITIINSDKIVMSGKKPVILARFKQKREMGATLKGPYYPKRADRIAKRTIRGMLPYKNKGGREALARVKCYIGVPEGIKIEEAQKVKGAECSKIKRTNYISLGEISNLLGARY